MKKFVLKDWNFINLTLFPNEALYISFRFRSYNDSILLYLGLELSRNLKDKQNIIKPEYH